ncbi:MAG: hypothetical protein Q9187_005415 [Circinaria calcarea]
MAPVSKAEERFLRSHTDRESSSLRRESNGDCSLLSCVIFVQEINHSIGAEKVSDCLEDTFLENSIPIVDLSAFLSNDDKQRQKIAQDLTEACHNLGFVYITGHGVSPELLDDAFQWSRKLFDLSHEDKMKAPHPPGPTPHRGYSHPGLEKVYSKQEASSDVVNKSQGSSLREVMDFKVCPSVASSLERLFGGE